MFVVVDFDALAQASDFKIKRRQVVFLCWMQNLNQGLWNLISSRLNARWQTDWAMLSRMKLKNWTQQPVPMISEHSAHSTLLPFGFRSWLWRYTCFLLLISMLWHRQAIFESKGHKLSYTYVHVIHTYIHNIHACAYIHTCIHTYVYISVCMHVCMYAHACMLCYVCMYI